MTGGVLLVPAEHLVHDVGAQLGHMARVRARDAPSAIVLPTMTRPGGAPGRRSWRANDLAAWIAQVVAHKESPRLSKNVRPTPR